MENITLQEKHDAYILCEIDNVPAIIFVNKDETIDMSHEMKNENRRKLEDVKRSCYKCILEPDNEARNTDIVLYYLAKSILNNEPIKIYSINK